MVHVVHAMGFGTLKNRSEPTRRADVPVVEVFRDGSEGGVERGCFDRETKNTVSEGCRNQGVDGDLHGVFVKTGEDFNPLWRVMELMAETPEEIGFVANAMPPIVNEGGDEVANDGAPEDGEFVAEVKKRGFLEPMVPGFSGENYDADLHRIDDYDAGPPAFGGRKFVARPDAFDEYKNESDGDQKKNHGRILRVLSHLSQSIKSALPSSKSMIYRELPRIRLLLL